MLARRVGLKVIKTVIRRYLVFLGAIKQRVGEKVLVRLLGSIVGLRLIPAFLKVFNLIGRSARIDLVRLVRAPSPQDAELVHPVTLQACAMMPKFLHVGRSGRSDYFLDCSVWLLRNAGVIGSSNLIKVGKDQALYEPYFHDRSQSWAYTDPGVVGNRDDLFLVKYRAGDAINQGILLSGNFSGNYYHFMFEFLSKWLLIEGSVIPVSVPVLIDRAILQVPQLTELLGYMNREGRAVRYVEMAEFHLVRELYWLPFCNVVAPNFKDERSVKYQDCVFSPKSILYLRSRIMPFAKEVKVGRRIFLSRMGASGRRTYNEEDVVRVFSAYGFELVSPEKLSVAEQVWMFSRAEWVAGCTGAAFTNVLFCSPGCKVICLANGQSELSIFSTVASIVEVDLTYIDVSNSSGEPAAKLHASFRIDPDRLKCDVGKLFEAMGNE